MKVDVEIRVLSEEESIQEGLRNGGLKIYPPIRSLCVPFLSVSVVQGGVQFLQRDLPFSDDLYLTPLIVAGQSLGYTVYVARTPPGWDSCVQRVKVTWKREKRNDCPVENR